jgi:hypothetical protein
LASHPDVAHKYSQQQPASSQRRRQGVEKKRPRPKSRVFGGGMLFPPSEVGPPVLPSETELEPLMQYPTAHHVRKHSGFGELKDRLFDFRFVFFFSISRMFLHLVKKIFIEINFFRVLVLLCFSLKLYLV